MMEIRLVSSLNGEEIHGTDNGKKTGCGINLQKNASKYLMSGVMSDLKDMTCEKCKTAIAKKIIKSDKKEMSRLIKEEKIRAKKGIEDENIVPLGNTTAKITAAPKAEPVPESKPVAAAASEPVSAPEAPKPVQAELGKTIPGTGVAIDSSLAAFAISPPKEEEPVQEAAPEDDFLAQFAIKKPDNTDDFAAASEPEAPVQQNVVQDDFLAQFSIPAPNETDASVSAPEESVEPKTEEIPYEFEAEPVQETAEKEPYYEEYNPNSFIEDVESEPMSDVMDYTEPVIEDIVPAAEEIKSDAYEMNDIFAAEETPAAEPETESYTPVESDTYTPVRDTVEEEPADEVSDDDIMKMFSISKDETENGGIEIFGQTIPKENSIYDNDDSVVDVNESELTIAEDEPEEEVTPEATVEETVEETVEDNEEISATNEWDMVANQLFGVFNEDVETVSQEVETPAEPEPMPEVETPVEPEPMPEVETPVEPEPMPEVEAPAEPEPMPEVETPVEPEPMPEVETPVEPEPMPEVETPAEPEPMPEVETPAEPEPMPEVETPVEPEPMPEVETPVEPEPMPEVETPAEPEPMPEVETPAEPEPMPEVAAPAAEMNDLTIESDDDDMKKKNKYKYSTPVFADEVAAQNNAAANVAAQQPAAQFVQPAPAPAPVQPMVNAAPQMAQPMPEQPMVMPVPQFAGYDMNGQPIYTYVQSQFAGYDQNGQPVFIPIQPTGYPQGVAPMQNVAPVAPQQTAPMQNVAPVAPQQAAPMQNVDPVAPQQAAPMQNVAPVAPQQAAPMQNVAPVAPQQAAPQPMNYAQGGVNISKISSEQPKAMPKSFANAVANSRAKNQQNLFDIQQQGAQMPVLDSIEDILSSMGDESIKKKREAEKAVPVFEEYKVPSKKTSAAKPAAAKPAEPQRPLTKAEIKAKKKQEKIDEKFRKDLAKRGF